MQNIALCKKEKPVVAEDIQRQTWTWPSLMHCSCFLETLLSESMAPGRFVGAGKEEDLS